MPTSAPQLALERTKKIPFRYKTPKTRVIPIRPPPSTVIIHCSDSMMPLNHSINPEQNQLETSWWNTAPRMHMTKPPIKTYMIFRMSWPNVSVPIPRDNIHVYTISDSQCYSACVSHAVCSKGTGVHVGGSIKAI